MTKKKKWTLFGATALVVIPVALVCVYSYKAIKGLSDNIQWEDSCDE